MVCEFCKLTDSQKELEQLKLTGGDQGWMNLGKAAKLVGLNDRALAQRFRRGAYHQGVVWNLENRRYVVNLQNKTRIELRRRVFLSRDNRPYLSPELMTAPGSWAGLLRRAKLAHREPYQLRHSYASMMLMIGAHPAYLAKQMGHKDWGMIRTIYARWIDNENPNYRYELAEKLGEFDPYLTPAKESS